MIINDLFNNKKPGVAEGWGGALAGAIGGGMIGGPVGAAVGGIGGYVLGGGNPNADLPDDPESAYKLGQQAARNGETEEDNPYEEGIFGPSDEMESWWDGWTDAQDGAKAQPQTPPTKQSSAPVAAAPKSSAPTKISGPADFSKLGFTSYKQESVEQGVAEGGIAVVGWPDEGNHTGNNPPVSVGGTVPARPVVKQGSLVKASGLTGVYRVMDIRGDQAKIREEIPNTGQSTYIPMSDLRVWTNKPVKEQGMAEGADEDMPVHRIGLTVIDPQHPMVSKRREEYQKTVRVPGHDREQAITAAINHLRRRGYKVLDHHYIGLLEDQLDELNKKTVASWIKQQPERIKGDTGLSRTDFKKAKRLVDKSIPSAIAKYKDPGYGKQEPQLEEGSLGDEMAALAQKKFPNAYISKNGEEVQKPENWGKKYVPPAAAPVDLEKQQRDLTAKYPNIDELVRRAELNRDPNYEYADGQAYYAARDAEQNYLKLKQIQRVIQGLNESLQRTQP
jgi:hypothetical protein